MKKSGKFCVASEKKNCISCKIFDNQAPEMEQRQTTKANQNEEKCMSSLLMLCHKLKPLCIFLTLSIIGTQLSVLCYLKLVLIPTQHSRSSTSHRKFGICLLFSCLLATFEKKMSVCRCLCVPRLAAKNYYYVNAYVHFWIICF